MPAQRCGHSAATTQDLERIGADGSQGFQPWQRSGHHGDRVVGFEDAPCWSSVRLSLAASASTGCRELVMGVGDMVEPL